MESDRLEHAFFLVLPDLPVATLHGQQHGGDNNRAHHHFRVRILR